MTSSAEDLTIIPHMPMFSPMLTEMTDTINAKNALKHAEYREDNAVQRQVADMKKAGINPIMAANYNGASSAAAVKAVDNYATMRNASSNRQNANNNSISSATKLVNSLVELIGKILG